MSTTTPGPQNSKLLHTLVALSMRFRSDLQHLIAGQSIAGDSTRTCSHTEDTPMGLTVTYEVVVTQTSSFGNDPKPAAPKSGYEPARHGSHGDGADEPIIR